MLFVWRDPIAFENRAEPYSKVENWSIRDQSPINCDPFVVLTYLGRDYHVLQEDVNHVLIEPRPLVKVPVK